MKKAVQEYIAAKNGLFRFFNCPDEYPVKTMTNSKWICKENESMHFLTCWNNEEDRADFAVAKKNGEVLMYKNKDYTMIIAIDCIKMAFILKNINEL